MATLIACPGVKLSYALLITSTIQGVGKSTLFNIVADILGISNVITVHPADIKKEFSSWKQKQLVIINELREDHANFLYDRLQSAITESRGDVRPMYQEKFETNVYFNILASSNSPRALRFPDTDRRWLIVKAADKKWPAFRWKRLHEWLEQRDGLRKVKQWARDYVEHHGAVDQSEEAPRTNAKEEMYVTGLSDRQMTIYNTLGWLSTVRSKKGEVETDNNTLKEVINSVRAGLELLTTDENVRSAVKACNIDGYVDSAAKVRELASHAGLFFGKDRIRDHRSSLPFNSRVIATSEELAAIDPKQLVQILLAQSKGSFHLPWSSGT